MLTKNEIKDLSLLLQKKYRKEYEKFLVEGNKLIIEALANNFPCELIVSTNQFRESSQQFLNNELVKKQRLETVKQIDFEKLCDTKTPQGVIGVFCKPQQIRFEPKAKFIVVLENISDPGNMGTIIRNCDWFGIKKIILSGDCAEVFSPKVIRASAGSVFHMRIDESENFYDDLENWKKNEYKIFCANLNGANVYSVDAADKMMVVFANEGNGPSQRMKQLTDIFVTIPKRGTAESLNVASASAVILSELTK